MTRLKWTVFGLTLLIATGCSPKMRAAPELKAPESAERIEQGRYLAYHITGCVDCHSPRDFSQPGFPAVEGKEFSGSTLVFDKRFKGNGEGFPGRAQTPNITQDVETGIGGWTDGEIARAIREGVNKHGRALFPMMPYTDYRNLSDEEVLAIIAFLRTVPPVSHKVIETKLNFPLNIIVNFIPAPLDGPVSVPVSDDPVKRGERLATLSGCHHCHSGTKRGEIIKGQEMMGFMVVDVREVPEMGFVTVATNITSDEETGIGRVDEAQFIAMMREGKAKDGRQLNGFMPWTFYKGMTDEDLKDIYAYLRSLPPIKHDANSRLAEFVK